LTDALPRHCHCALPRDRRSLHAGQRNVATVALNAGKRQEIESLRFAGNATLFTGEGDAALSVFEVDPRDRPDRGQGPTLYKEWKLSAPAAGSGVFRPGIAPRQLLTLVLQGAATVVPAPTIFRTGRW
jgi:hypothetical protein